MFVGREAIISAIKERHKVMGQRHERVAFHDSHNGRWLMVFDNADNYGMIFRGNASNE